jgi:hypothetical protein
LARGHFIESDRGAFKVLSPEDQPMLESLRKVRRRFISLYEHDGGGAQQVWIPLYVLERWPPETYLEEGLRFFPRK